MSFSIYPQWVFLTFIHLYFLVIVEDIQDFGQSGVVINNQEWLFTLWTLV